MSLRINDQQAAIIAPGFPQANLTMPTLTAKLSEAAGVTRLRSPLTAGLPFAAGELRDPDRIVLRDSQGRLFPSCAEVRSRWPDGSIRWALLDAQVDVKAMEQADLTISYGEQTQPAAQLKSPLRATDRGDAIDIATGTLLARLGKSGSRLFVSVSESRHEYLDLSSDTADLRAWNEVGQSFDGVFDTACIEESNPLRVVVLAHGGFVAEERLLSWIARVCFFAYNSTVRAYVTIVHDQDRPEIHLQRVSLALPLPLWDAVQATVGSNSGLWQFDDAVEVSRDAPLEMTQSNVERHHIQHSTPAIVVDRRSNCTGWLQVADADHALSLKVRRPWQSFPKRWWTDGRQIGVICMLICSNQRAVIVRRLNKTIQRWVANYIRRMTNHCGCRKEWHARMNFSCTSVFPQTVDDRSINGLWLRRCHCFCSCLSQRFADTRVFGHFQPFREQLWPLELRLRQFCRPPNGRGFVNDGDVVRFERDDEGRQCTRTTENLAYDLPPSILRQYVRSGVSD